jgi:ATP-binding cassette, subfamily B, bacterial
MREHWRAIGLLVRTAWRCDRRRSAALLLGPVAHLRLPLFAVCIKLMTDGAFGHDARLVAIGAVGIGATSVAVFVCVWVGSWCRVRVSETVAFALNREIAALTTSVPGLEHHERADYQDRLHLLREGNGILGTAFDSLISTANLVVAGIGTLVTLAVITPWALAMVPFTLPALAIALKQQAWFAEAEARSAEPGRRCRDLRRLTLDRNAGMELRVFGLGSEIVSRLGRAWHESRSLPIAAARRVALLDGASDMAFVAGFAGLVSLMLWRASAGQATAGDVVMAVFLAQQMKTAVSEPIRSVGQLGETLRAAGRILWLRDYLTRETAAVKGTQPAPTHLFKGIVFDRTSFRYPSTDRWVLRDFSLRIPAGAVMALVGENGAGKSTFVKLLCRMYEPTEGRILIDGVDLAQIDVVAWRTQLSAAFQDFSRFEFLAQHAVGVGDLARIESRPAVRAALERAGASSVLTQLPRGAETQLGARWDSGVDLSAGQWQKVALGRALVREAPLVVFLDEPTASLDAVAEHALFEQHIRAAEAGRARGAITVLVSHRFSTVRSADLIVVIDQGRVRESGSHEDLMRRGDLYAELYELQAKGYAA